MTFITIFQIIFVKTVNFILQFDKFFHKNIFLSIRDFICPSMTIYEQLTFPVFASHNIKFRVFNRSLLMESYKHFEYMRENKLFPAFFINRKTFSQSGYGEILATWTFEYSDFIQSFPGGNIFWIKYNWKKISPLFIHCFEPLSRSITSGSVDNSCSFRTVQAPFQYF